MTNIDAIQSAMNEIAVVELINGEIHITTHCLYPSNSAVSVIVRGSGNAFVVTDDGGAIGEVGSTGMREGPNDRQIRALVKAHGLEVKGGVIYAPPVKFDEISAAVLLVANASKEVADWCLSHLRFTQPRNFRRDLSTPSLRRNPMLIDRNKAIEAYMSRRYGGSEEVVGAIRRIPPAGVTDEMVELAARALSIADGKNPDADFRDQGNMFLSVATDTPQNWRRYVKKARAALIAAMGV